MENLAAPAIAPRSWYAVARVRSIHTSELLFTRTTHSSVPAASGSQKWRSCETQSVITTYSRLRLSARASLSSKAPFSSSGMAAIMP